jgi:hypothetical protein
MTQFEPNLAELYRYIQVSLRTRRIVGQSASFRKVNGDECAGRSDLMTSVIVVPPPDSIIDGTDLEPLPVTPRQSSTLRLFIANRVY